MKRSILFMITLLLIGGISCKKDFLDEKPGDFLSSSNAFVNAADFNASVNNLYRLVRTELYTAGENGPWDYLNRTDLAVAPISGNPPNFQAEYNPVNSFTNGHWNAWYKIVAESNTIISRIPKSQLSDNDKKLFEARARFFRAFAYRCLAYLFGGVPLELEEVVEPKTDYTRATRKEVYKQVIEDLVFAAANLPGINAVARDGEVSNLAAQHLLSEVYIADGQYQKAVDAATIVITDANMALMTTRFGTRRTETPGDVYWDMFRRGNQNRKGAGQNRESIWVAQIEMDIPGGGGSTTPSGFPFPEIYTLERVHVPLLRDLKLPTGGSPALREPINWPAADYSSGGRGVGFMAPSMYFVHNIYQYQGTGATPDSVNDIRNANHNLVRKFAVTRPGNPLYPVGYLIDFDNLPAGTTGFNGALMKSGDTYNRTIYPYQTKATEPFNPPANLLDPAKQFPYQLKGVAAGTYRDEYIFRLAETYLLRAEAYLGLGKTTEAAADINVVRARSSASPVAAASVDIDLILDERLRELGMEERRMFTLLRLGKWFDRVKKCNPFYAPVADPKYNLWPIPQAEIDRNRTAKLEQNPGYPS